jgi:hypothetical protein
VCVFDFLGVLAVFKFLFECISNSYEAGGFSFFLDGINIGFFSVPVSKSWPFLPTFKYYSPAILS